MPELLSCIEVNPSLPPVGCVIWLHGLGADGNDFAPLVPELKLPATLPLRFIFPHAPLMPVTINNGYVMRAWYDIATPAFQQQPDLTGIARSVNAIQQLIAREESAGISAAKIILAGFSQGAAIALTAGLTATKPLGGIIALSGYLPDIKILTAKQPLANTTPIFLAHGTEDSVVPYGFSQQLAQQLKQQQFQINWQSYPMEHSVCAAEINAISRWLQDIFSVNSR